jgi:hypothetical protein
MVISTPEATMWVPFSKPREGFEHLPCGIGFEYDLCGFNRVPFWDVHQEVDMIEGKAEVAKLEPKAFQVMERLDAGVDVDLFSKAIISVAGVTRNLFRATANYIFHTIFFSCRVREG